MDYNDLNLEELSIQTLGKLIYNTSISLNLKLRDALVSVFQSKISKELTDSGYHFSIQKQDTNSLVPCLLISSHVDSVTDVTRVFYILREYLQLHGNLRITDNPYYINNDGTMEYFERGDNILTLLLDFTEYECNKVYGESSMEVNI